MEDVCVWKVGPKRVIDVTEAFILEEMWIFPVLVTAESMLCAGWVPASVCRIVSSLIWWHHTFGAPVLHTTCNETLLGMVCHVRSKDGKYTADLSVGADHIDAALPSFDKRLQQKPHAVVKCIVSGILPAWLVEC